jgi:hypothetical protein
MILFGKSRLPRKFIIFVILTLISGHKIFAQLYFPEDMVKVSATVIDQGAKTGVPYANVINQRIRGGTMTDAEGKFSLQADPSDTLTFKSLGYKDKLVPVSEILAQKQDSAIIIITPIRYLLEQVDVQGEALKVNMTGIPQGKPNPIPASLRSDFAGKPSPLAAVFHPASFLNYKFSKSEKEKRATLSAIRSEKQWAIFSLVYNKDALQRITGLTGQALDDFMVYCNANNNLPVGATTYEVQVRVTEVYEQYKKEKALE